MKQNLPSLDVWPYKPWVKYIGVIFWSISPCLHPNTCKMTQLFLRLKPLIFQLEHSTMLITLRRLRDNPLPFPILNNYLLVIDSLKWHLKKTFLCVECLFQVADIKLFFTYRHGLNMQNCVSVSEFVVQVCLLSQLP